MKSKCCGKIISIQGQLLNCFYWSRLAPFPPRKITQIMVLARPSEILVLSGCGSIGEVSHSSSPEFFLQFQDRQHRVIEVLKGPLQEIQWGYFCSGFCRGPCLGNSTVQMTLYASLRGWGSHPLGKVTQGSWTYKEANLSISFLISKANIWALLAFQDLQVRKDVLIHTDNTTSKSYIIHWGT